MRFTIAIFVGLLSVEAYGGCEVASTLVQEYGITYAGFHKSPPRTEQPKLDDKSFVEVWSQQSPSGVKDAFTHSIYVNEKLNNAWIHRTGGYAGVYEWYGPLQVEVGDISACITYNAAAGPLTNRSTATPESGAR